MTDDLDRIVAQVVASFRPGAPIVIDDVRFAAQVDGYDLRTVSGGEIAASLRRACCQPTRPEHSHRHDRVSWRRERCRSRRSTPGLRFAPTRG